MICACSVMHQWPSLRSIWLDTCIGQVFFPFLSTNNNKAKVQASWPNIYYMAKRTFFFLLLFCSGSQSGTWICFILPPHRTSCVIIIGIITWYKPSRSISTGVCRFLFLPLPVWAVFLMFLFFKAFTTDFEVHWGQHPLRPELVESTYFLYEVSYLCVSVSQS